MSRRPDRNTLAALARSFKLAWGRTPLAGAVGEKLGSATGASTEFHDYRAYVPGDDIRYIDWKAYARSDALTVRLFREEIAPRVDLVVDETASMALDEEKAVRFQEIAMLVSLLAAEARASVRVFGRGESEPLRDPLSFAAAFAPGHDPWPPLEGLRWRSVRVVLSDFLFPHDPRRLVAALARGAGQLFLIQLTSPEETEPTARGPVRLIEVEDGTRLDLAIGEAEVERYRTRLRRMVEDLRREAKRARGLWCSLSSALTLEESVAALARAGMLESP